MEVLCKTKGCVGRVVIPKQLGEVPLVEHVPVCKVCNKTDTETYNVGLREDGIMIWVPELSDTKPSYERHEAVATALARFMGGTKSKTVRVGEQMKLEGDAKKKADYEAWMEEAQERGFKSGWAAYRYKDEYGDWPPREWGKTQAKPKPKPRDKTRCSACDGEGWVDAQPSLLDDVPF